MFTISAIAFLLTGTVTCLYCIATMITGHIFTFTKPALGATVVLAVGLLARQDIEIVWVEELVSVATMVAAAAIIARNTTKMTRHRPIQNDHSDRPARATDTPKRTPER